jgi:hypothetical protein
MKWQKVLRVMYEEGIVWSLDSEIDETHPLVVETDLPAEDVEDALSFLSESGLIGRIQAGAKADYPREMVVGISDSARQQGTHIGLTTEGFKVAHNRELQNQQQRTNHQLAGFTAILAISAIVQATAALSSVFRPLFSAIYLIVFTLLLAYASKQFELDF